MTDFQIPMPRIPEVKSPAEYAKEALIGRIRAFEARLGDDEEMTVIVAGIPLPFRITGIGTASSFIVFHGEDANGRPAEAYQHVTQANVTLIATPKPDGAEPRRIGFDTSASA